MKIHMQIDARVSPSEIPVEAIDKSLSEMEAAADDQDFEVVSQTAGLPLADDQDFEVVSQTAGLPFTKHTQHVHAALMSKSEEETSPLGGENTLMVHLKNKDAKRLKAFLRKNTWGPSHPIRGCIWRQACEYLHRAKGNVYEEFEKEVFHQSKYNIYYLHLYTGKA